MCGIAGIVGAGADALADRVQAMISALNHRGPDEQGMAVFQNAVLGSARLSIIDPVGGHQPLFSPDRQVATVCNGEIYGFERLREQYSQYPFRTGSDCEVVLPLFDEYGEELLPHLPGTFSLAIWDDRSQSLLLARDRFGERPLYFATTSDGLLAFASESHALRAAGFGGMTPDPRMVAEMLRQGYVPSGQSIWSDIESIPHASRLRCSLGKAPRMDRWWTPPEVMEGISEEEAARWFRGALDAAVEEQLEADVPVGTFLSGGIDSTTVAALAAAHHPDLHAFTFDMPGESEVAFARDTAAKHAMTLHVLTPDTSNLADEILQLATTWDEPFGDSSSLPTSLLCKFAREHVKVALTGDGADELLGGYVVWARGTLEPGTPGAPPLNSAASKAGSQGNAGTQGNAAGSVLSRMKAQLRTRRSATDSRGSGGGSSSGSDVARRYASFRQYFTASQLTDLGLPAVGANDIDLSTYNYGTADDISRFDLDHYLPGDILVKTDRASMAHGLEVRSPFLDVKVAEGCLALPAHHKVNETHEKLLLRRACGDLWPASVSDRRKQGFGSPMASWLQLPDVAELKHAHLQDPDSALFDLVDRDAVQALSAENDQRTWNLLMLSIWWSRSRNTVSAP
jgi:asparagine synthase (glutamine-hydrolysing)